MSYEGFSVPQHQMAKGFLEVSLDKDDNHEDKKVKRTIGEDSYQLRVHYDAMIVLVEVVTQVSGVLVGVGTQVSGISLGVDKTGITISSEGFSR